MNKLVVGLVIALIGGVVGYFVLTGGDDADNEQAQNTSLVNEPASNQTTTAGADDPSDVRYTFDDVAQRNSVDECWTVIDGIVYDITAYVPNHPGGASTISLACGTDGTQLFTERVDENGQAIGSGSPHSAGATSTLQSYRIGIID